VHCTEPLEPLLVEAGSRVHLCTGSRPSRGDSAYLRLPEARTYGQSCTVRTFAGEAGKEEEVKGFLESAVALANRETTTPVWFALRMGPATFAIFDAFAGDAARQAHLAGDIAGL